MIQFYKILKEYVRPYKKYVSWAIILNILSAILNIFSFSMLIPILRILFKMSDKVYEYIAFSPDMSWKEYGNTIMNNIYWWINQTSDSIGGSWTLFILCMFLGIMTLFKTLSYFASSAVMVPIRTGVVQDIRRKLYRKILDLPIGFFSQERKGDIIARITGDVSEIESSIMSTLDMLIKNPILIIIYFLTMLIISWQLTIFTILIVPALGWIMGVIGRKLRRQSTEAQELWSDSMSLVEETLGGLRVIKAFTAEKDINKRYNQITEDLKNKVAKVSIRQASAHPVSEFLGTVLIMIVLWFGGTLILSDSSSIDAATFMFYMVILYSIINPLKDFAKATYNIPKGMASVERVDKILKAENTIREKKNAIAITEFKDSIQMQDITFSYSKHKTILKKLDFSIKKGHSVAIVGESGAGKSTLVDLIPRFYDVNSGVISIDGVDIRDLKINDLRKMIGYVNQEPILFNDTIYNNIAFGVENAKAEDVIAAAKIANAHDFIMEKEGGYQCNIGDRGTKLSGGQRQRISIARAILKNPPILILDEATASLDTESERLVQEALIRLMSNRTTIAIAHRLSTIKNSDEILVMSDGKIVERGKHDELIALKGYYKRLNDMQSL